MMTPATPNRFQAVLETVRAGDDQARCDAEAARATLLIIAGLLLASIVVIAGLEPQP